MTAVTDTLDRIEAYWRSIDPKVQVPHVHWLLALARGHQATLEAIAAGDDEYPAVEWEHKLARERLREAEGE